MSFRYLLLALLAGMPVSVSAADQSSDNVAIGCFFSVIALTLFITYWAARRTRTADDFYVAGSSITGTQNGLAIAGDFMSAATMLGVAAVIFTAGYDAVIYMLAPVLAFAVMLMLMTDKLRALGRYTFTDVISLRLDPKPMRVLAATTALVSAVMYLMVQIVGAGALIQVLFAIDYKIAVVMVGTLMIIYVAVGGMLATTWVQITKAVLLLTGITALALLVLVKFNFSMGALFDAALDVHMNGDRLVRPGGLNLSLVSALSLALGLGFGLVGSPHVLMRFFTVPNAAAARRSAFVAMLAVSYVNVVMFFIIAVGAVALVSGNTDFLDETGQIIGGANMVVIHAAEVVGGKLFLGVISAVAFATILAVVAGLTIASASAVSHDLYANVFRHGRSTEKEEVLVSRISTVVLGVIMMTLGIAFEGQNIAYLVSLALTVAASTNFPLLILTSYWRGFTTRGALAGGIGGLLTAIGLVILGPAVWVSIFGFDKPVFPSGYPAIYSMSVAFIGAWLFSVTDKSPRAVEDRERFDNLIAKA
jgi:cation/acetate symporter